MEDNQAELIGYLRILWRQKWVLIATFVAAVVTAGGVSWVMAPTYRVETTLLLLPSLASTLGAEAGGSALPADAYEKLMLSAGVVRVVLGTAGYPPEFTIADFRELTTVNTEPQAGGQFLLDATLIGSDRSQLPLIMQAWTEAFSSRFTTLFEDRTSRSYDYIRQNYTDTELELKSLNEQRTLLLLDHPIEILRSDIESLRLQYDADTAQLAEARQDLVASKARVAGLESELQGQSQRFTLRRNLEPDSLLAVTVSTLTAREMEALLSIDVESEIISSVWIRLEEQATLERAEVASLNAAIRSLSDSTAEIRTELEQRERELIEVEAELAEIDRQIYLKTVAQGKLATEFETAKIAIAETPDPIRILDEPFVPEMPIAPKKALNLALAGFLGLMLGSLLAFFVDYLARVRAEERSPEPSTRPGSAELRYQKTNEKPQSTRANNGENSSPRLP